MGNDSADLIRDALLCIAHGDLSEAGALAERLARVDVVRVGKPARSAVRASAPPTRTRCPSSITIPVKARLYAADHYTCRYCGRRTVLEATFVYLNAHFPDFVAYHGNWLTGCVHPLVPIISASLDHIQPIAQNGSNDEANLATTCADCNYTKRDSTLSELGWSQRSGPAPDWDGATGALAQAMIVAPTPHPWITPWMPWIQAG
jgi:hypothetical protein